jgi:hypothetical protein
MDDMKSHYDKLLGKCLSLEKEKECLKEYISQLEQEKDSMAKSLYKILRIANKELND